MGTRSLTLMICKEDSGGSVGSQGSSLCCGNESFGMTSKAANPGKTSFRSMAFLKMESRRSVGASSKPSLCDEDDKRVSRPSRAQTCRAHARSLAWRAGVVRTWQSSVAPLGACSNLQLHCVPEVYHFTRQTTTASVASSSHGIHLAC